MHGLRSSRASYLGSTPTVHQELLPVPKIRQTHSLLSILVPACSSLPHTLQIFTWLTLITDFSACINSSEKPSLIWVQINSLLPTKTLSLGNFFFPKLMAEIEVILSHDVLLGLLSVLRPPVVDWAQVRIFLICPWRASVPGATPSIAGWMNEMQVVIWYYMCLEMFNKQWKIKITSALRSPVYLPPGQTIRSSCVALHEC